MTPLYAWTRQRLMTIVDDLMAKDDLDDLTNRINK